MAPSIGVRLRMRITMRMVRTLVVASLLGSELRQAQLILLAYAWAVVISEAFPKECMKGAAIQLEMTAETLEAMHKRQRPEKAESQKCAGLKKRKSASEEPENTQAQKAKTWKDGDPKKRRPGKAQAWKGRDLKRWKLETFINNGLFELTITWENCKG